MDIGSLADCTEVLEGLCFVGKPNGVSDRYAISLQFSLQQLVKVGISARTLFVDSVINTFIPHLRQTRTSLLTVSDLHLLVDHKEKTN